MYGESRKGLMRRFCWLYILVALFVTICSWSVFSADGESLYHMGGSIFVMGISIQLAFIIIYLRDVCLFTLSMYQSYEY